ncbi:hypothetical protein [Achromobacter xylosoxidans]|nr:hypothetical protein [Achromobacter xylosoxidans]
MDQQQPLFEMRDIVKEFSGVRALWRQPGVRPANAWACAARTAPASRP